MRFKDIIPLILVLLVLIFGIFLSVYLLQREVRLRGKAYEEDKSRIYKSGEIDFENSYIFASPLKAKAGGIEKIRITVYLLDGQGRGVSGKLVRMGKNEDVFVQAIQATTDDLGRAIFDVSSQEPGIFVFKAFVDSKEIPQNVQISFY